MKKIKCIVCGNNKFKTLVRMDSHYNPTIKNLQISKCTKCGLVLMNPQPGQEVIKTFYQDCLFERKRKKRFVNRIKNIYEYSRLKNILKLKPNAKNVLDVGCANGSFLKICKRVGLDVYGTEISENAVEYCKKTLKTQNIFLGDVNGVRNVKKIDVITLWDVFEHLRKPGEYLEHIYKILNSDGLLVIQTMDIASWSYKISKKNWGYFGDQHLFYFSKKTLSRLLGKHGFKIVKTKAYNNTFLHLCLFLYTLPKFFLKKSKFPDYWDLYEYYIVKK